MPSGLFAMNGQITALTPSCPGPANPSDPIWDRLGRELGP